MNLKIKITLLVVMSAVNWWKWFRNETPVEFLLTGVRWNSLRSFGKVLVFRRHSAAAQILQQTIRKIPTQSTHLLHTPFTGQFFRKLVR